MNQLFDEILQEQMPILLVLYLFVFVILLNDFSKYPPFLKWKVYFTFLYLIYHVAYKMSSKLSVEEVNRAICFFNSIKFKRFIHSKSKLLKTFNRIQINTPDSTLDRRIFYFKKFFNFF